MPSIEELTLEQTEAIHKIIEGYFINPSEDWEEYKGMSFNQLEEKLHSSKQEWNSIYMLAVDDYFCKEELNNV